MPQFINEKEFDKKLQDISDAYEKVKDVLHAVDPHCSVSTYDALRLLRDVAATGLRAQYEIVSD